MDIDMRKLTDLALRRLLSDEGGPVSQAAYDEVRRRAQLPVAINEVENDRAMERAAGVA